MVPYDPEANAQPDLLKFVKELSGRRIELARRRHGLSQMTFARDVGIGTRWLREIESGNPASSLDLHIRCAHQLKLSTGHILLPLLFHAHEMAFPHQLASSDLRQLERACIDIISERTLRDFTHQLTPRWRPSAAAG